MGINAWYSRRRCAKYLVVLACSGLAAETVGCASGSTGGPSENSGNSADQVSAGPDVTPFAIDVLSDYQSLIAELPIPLLADDQRLLLITAEARLIDSCVHAAGFEGYKTYVATALGPNQFTDAVRQLGILPVDPNGLGYGLLSEIR